MIGISESVKRQLLAILLKPTNCCWLIRVEARGVLSNQGCMQIHQFLLCEE